MASSVVLAVPTLRRSRLWLSVAALAVLAAMLLFTSSPAHAQGFVGPKKWSIWLRTGKKICWQT